MSRYLALMAAVGLWIAIGPARAQDPAADYPNRPVKIIVTVPAGGTKVQAMEWRFSV